MKKAGVILFVILCCRSVFCQAQTTVTFKPNATTGQDASIGTSYGCTMQGNTQPNEYLNCGNSQEITPTAWTYNSNGCSMGTARSLLRFDELSKIPVNATIIQAKLKLYGVSFTGNNAISVGNSCYPGSPSLYADNCPNNCFIQKVTSAWNEQTVTWNTQPTTTPANQITIPQSTLQWNWNFADSSANLVAMVQDWVTNPSKNFGVMIKQVTESYYRSVLFASSDHPNSALHPELIVTYTVCLADTTTFNAAICNGETYQENGFNVSKSGTYTQNLKNSAGCDSLVILDLSVTPFDTTVIYDTICINNAYAKYGFDIPASELQTAGIVEFRDTIPSITGCDTLIILNLNVIEKEIFTLNAVICYGYVYQENGFNVSDSGTYYDTLQNRFGCDSIVILNLTVKLQDTNKIFAEICDGERYTQNNFNETKSGIYTQNRKNKYGCDSTVILYLTVKPTPKIEILPLTDNFCNDDFIILEIISNGESFLWNTGSSENPLTLTKAGTYTATAFIENCSKTAHYTVEECPCVIWIPNAFTPNGDELNELFRPLISCHETLKSYKLHIYDRWGNLIFQTSDYAVGWNGKDNNGKDYAAGVYNYLIEYVNSKNERVRKNASVTLVR